MAKAAKKPPTKTEVLNSIAEATDLTKKQVGAVFDEEVKFLLVVVHGRRLVDASAAHKTNCRPAGVAKSRNNRHDSLVGG